MSVELGLMISLVGCLVALAGWLAAREKHIAGDAEWRGSVNAKLDVIVGMKDDLARVNSAVQEYGERLTRVEASAAQAHRRVDELAAERGRG